MAKARRVKFNFDLLKDLEENKMAIKKKFSIISRETYKKAWKNNITNRRHRHWYKGGRLTLYIRKAV